MGLLIDTTPLRVSRDFRRLWIGQAISFLGSTMTAAALPFQVYRQTNSSLAVGLLGVAQLGPLLVFSIVGGALADSIDKRLLLIGVTIAAAACSTGLAVNASLDHPQLWLVFVLGATASGVTAVTFPVLRSLLPLLLEESLRPAAFALQSTYGSFGMMAGPAVGGVLIGTVGLTSTYGVDVATYALALAAFAGIAAAPPVGDGDRASVASIRHGLRFLRGQPVIISVFGIDLLAMIFGMPRALFPALTARLGGGATLYGFLLSSVAAGAFVASLTSGWTTRVRRQGLAVLWSVAIWGAAIAVAGLTVSIAIVLACLAAAGAADMISGVYRSAIAADVTPDDLRGRISGVELAVYAGGPQLGDVEAGVVGGLVSVPFAIVSGGVACVAAAAVFALRVKSFTRYVSPVAEQVE
ncbi:MAG TPA: MFS transporter [Acidimicrobiia bacterium]|nr:MFS transporter [Acidimicrobiia bacterium]